MKKAEDSSERQVLDPVYIGLLRDLFCFVLLYNNLKIVNVKDIVKSGKQKEIDKY